MLVLASEPVVRDHYHVNDYALLTFQCVFYQIVPKRKPVEDRPVNVND